jgi:hypothetical protein
MNLLRFGAFSKMKCREKQHLILKKSHNLCKDAVTVIGVRQLRKMAMIKM